MKNKNVPLTAYLSELSTQGPQPAALLALLKKRRQTINEIWPPEHPSHRTIRVPLELTIDELDELIGAMEEVEEHKDRNPHPLIRSRSVYQR